MSSQVLIEFSPLELLSAKQVIEVSYSTIDTRKEKRRTGVANVCNRLLIQRKFSSTKYLRCLINIDPHSRQKNVKCTWNLDWLCKHVIHCSILRKIFSWVKGNQHFIDASYASSSRCREFRKAFSFYKPVKSILNL